MTLFSLVRDFFVEHIFGGRTSTGQTIITGFGRGLANNGVLGNVNNTDLYVPLSIKYFGNSQTYDFMYSVSDWLSTTATIISMVFIVVLACLFIRWIFKVVSGAILLK